MTTKQLYRATESTATEQPPSALWMVLTDGLLPSLTISLGDQILESSNAQSQNPFLNTEVIRHEDR